MIKQSTCKHSDTILMGDVRCLLRDKVKGSRTIHKKCDCRSVPMMCGRRIRNENPTLIMLTRQELESKRWGQSISFSDVMKPEADSYNS